VKFYEFLEKAPKIPSVVVIEGVERIFAERAVAAIVERVLAPAERDLNLERIDLGAPEALARTSASIAALPFLGSARVVVARGACDLKAAPRRELAIVAGSVPDGNILVIEDLVSPSSKRPEPLAKLLGRGVLRVDTTPVPEARERFVRETLAALGRSAEPVALGALASGEADLGAVRTDLEKLALLGRTIALEDVLAESLVAIDVKAYQYAKAAVAGDVAAATRLAHELFTADPRGAAIPLVAALASEYALVWEMARPGGSLPSRAKWRERELRPVAARLGMRRARLGFERAIKGFEAIVTGRADDPRLVIELATMFAQGGVARGSR